MQLSIIIVNYNVRHFLEQCLYSVRAAMKGLNAEVWVVDNQSSDGSLEYLQPRFTWVQFLASSENLGFAKANNLAVEKANGEHILFLNPDTLIPADSLRKCLDFMAQHPTAGSLGVRMLDGSGRFLPESKRAFPSPLTSLFKLSGLSALFPHSPLFSRYHLGHLADNEDHEVDVLAGAFMWVRKAALLKTNGAFDPAFFMYGEDVDLSYRIQQAGFKNYYFSGVSILHFKGESTKKGSLNYVRMFYQAMSLFVQKHYGSGEAGIFSFLIKMAIWFRAMVSALTRFIKWVGLPLFDAAIVLACLGGMALFWATYIKTGIQYQPHVWTLILPLFTVSFLVAGGVAGLYDVWYRPARAWLAMMAALIINLAIYSLLGVDFRFSRGVILFGGLFAASAILLFRVWLVKMQIIGTHNEGKEFRRTLIVGNPTDFEAAKALMTGAGRLNRILGRISVNGEKELPSLGSLHDLSSILQSVPAREIVFCLGTDLCLNRVLEFMDREKRNIRYKFFYGESGSMVGSDNKETAGEALAYEENFNLALSEIRRMKRIRDIGFSLLFFGLWLLLFWRIKKPFAAIKNAGAVIIGKKTWVGYGSAAKGLPGLKPAVIAPNGLPVHHTAMLQAESRHTIDYWYAKDYEWTDDLRIFFKSFAWLGG